MASVYTNVLSDEELSWLTNLPEVLSAKASVDSRSSGVVYFTIPVTESLRIILQTRVGLHLSVGSSIPMRWIKGDTAPHVDVGPSSFQHTYLVYLTNSPGEFHIGTESYPITQGTAFVFQEGLRHETIHTGSDVRLLLGPMNELAQPVGGFSLLYYPTEQDALNDTNTLGGSSTYIVSDGGPFGGFTSWRLASNSTGSSPQNVVYPNGSTLIGDGVYYLYPSAPCFLEGSTLLCQVNGIDTYVPVEQLKNGTLVKTSIDGYKPVVSIGKGTLQNRGDDTRIQNRLYKCSPSKYPQLKEDLYITGCHSILEFPITDKQKEDTIKHLGRLFITDKKYRLMACVDERAEPWNSAGDYIIWHVALEHHDEAMNYGVYANGGLLVETCSIRFLKKHSNMTIV